MPSSVQPKKGSNIRRADHQNPSGIFALPTIPSRPMSESISTPAAGPPGVTGRDVPQAQAGGLLQKTLHASEVISRTREETGESWDDDFASDISFSKLTTSLPAVKKSENVGTEESDQNTLRPRHSPVVSSQPLPLVSVAQSSRSLSKLSVEDYSDIASGEDMADLDKKLANIKVD